MIYISIIFEETVRGREVTVKALEADAEEDTLAAGAVATVEKLPCDNHGAFEIAVGDRLSRPLVFFGRFQN